MNAQLHTAAKHRRTVMLVDDDPRVRRALGLLLRLSAEWEIAGEVVAAAQVLEQARQLRPDLILLDRSLPDGDGLDLLPELMALQPPPRVVLLTAELHTHVQERALALGAALCLDKLTPPGDLPGLLRGLWPSTTQEGD